MPLRRILKKTRYPLIMLLVGSLLGLTSSIPAAEADPTPERPLLLIGGTFVHDDYAGWEGIIDWLEEEGGYEEDVNLFVWEMARQEEEPAGWPGLVIPTPPYYVPSWDVFVDDYLGDNGYSTAGLAPMDESVANVGAAIDVLYSQLGEIDVIAHSQGAPIVRKYIREKVEASQPNPVHTLISLGGVEDGISTGSGFSGWFESFFLWGTLAQCRTFEWLPVCPDLIYFSPPLDEYKAGHDFFPDLNDPGGAGPVPGDTVYVHFYTTLQEAGGPVELDDGEARLLPAPAANLSVQDFCLYASPPVPDRPVPHVGEWEDLAMRELMVSALGIRYADPTAGCV